MSEPKKWVKERYGVIAAKAGASCCAQSNCCDTTSSVSERLGYTPDNLASVPTGADLGLGCGNPTALASIEPGETVIDLGSGAGLDAFLAAARRHDALAVHAGMDKHRVAGLGLLGRRGDGLKRFLLGAGPVVGGLVGLLVNDPVPSRRRSGHPCQCEDGDARYG